MVFGENRGKSRALCEISYFVGSEHGALGSLHHIQPFKFFDRALHFLLNFEGTLAPTSALTSASLSNLVEVFERCRSLFESGVLVSKSGNGGLVFEDEMIDFIGQILDELPDIFFVLGQFFLSVAWVSDVLDAVENLGNYVT